LFNDCASVTIKPDFYEVKQMANTKKITAHDHKELVNWKKTLLAKQTHEPAKLSANACKVTCCKLHTLFRCLLGSAFYISGTLAFLKYICS